MTTPNVELLTKTLARIKANPEDWNQDFYRHAWGCGTVMCFAGWAATLAGGVWAGDGDCLEATDEDPPGQVIDGVVHAAHRARRILGITHTESDDLFHPNNGLHDLEKLVAELCAQVGR